MVVEGDTGLYGFLDFGNKELKIYNAAVDDANSKQNIFIENNE